MNRVFATIASVASSVFYVALALWLVNSYVLGNVPGPAGVEDTAWYAYGTAAIAFAGLMWAGKNLLDKIVNAVLDFAKEAPVKAAETVKSAIK